MVKKKINEGLVKGKSKMTEVFLNPNRESKMTEPLPIQQMSVEDRITADTARWKAYQDESKEKEVSPKKRKKRIIKSIEKELPVYQYLKRYSGGDVFGKSDYPQVTRIDDNRVFISRVTDENGKYLRHSSKGAVDKENFKKNMTMHFEEEKAKHPLLEKATFINRQIEYLKGIDEDLKKDYGYDLNSLKILFEGEREGLFTEKATFTNKSQKAFEPKHRTDQLVHEFKVSAGIEELLTSKQLKGIAPKRYQKYLTLQVGNKGYKAPTKKELEKVITLLSGFPDAKTLAEDYLNKHYPE